jgi:hypothetical protein
MERTGCEYLRYRGHLVRTDERWNKNANFRIHLDVDAGLDTDPKKIEYHWGEAWGTTRHVIFF